MTVPFQNRKRASETKDLTKKEINKEGVGAVKRTDQVYNYLRQGILSGEILSRTRLIESEIASMLDASRTPVREAISRLIQDQLVKPLTSGGVEVVDTLSEYDEICYIREALEGVAVRLAAKHITDEELIRLEHLALASTESYFEDYQRRSEINWEFHDIVYQASRSNRLIVMIGNFRDFFINKQVLEMYTKIDTETAVKHHFEIVEALQKRDGKLAEILMRKHLEHFRKKANKMSNTEMVSF